MGIESIVDENSTFPKTENDITEEWICKNVGMTPLPKSVTVEGNIQDGVGFLSNLCRVSFQIEGGIDQNILVKLLPVNPEYRALTLCENFDEREIQFYAIVKPRMIEVAPELENNLCKFYCGKISKNSNNNTDDDYASMLVIGDLKPLGYQMLNPESIHWQENLGKVIKFLAKFHCASLTLEKSSGTTISELFPFCMGIGGLKLEPPMIMQLAKTNVVRLDPFLEKNNASSELRASYKYIADNVLEYFELTLQEASKFPCVIHGDIWPPNVMIAEDTELPVKVIDWQLLGYKDPAIELTIAILTCVPKAELKKENMDAFCKLYVDTCEKLGCNFGRSKVDFQKCFDTWGMIYAYYWFVLSFDSFPDDMERLFLVFEFIQNEYKISEFLKSYSSIE